MSERPILFSGAGALRFEERVVPEPLSGCWLWCGTLNAKGYGRFGNTMAHRFALKLSGREVPPGYEVDHLCRVRACVNPAHLDIVTHAENIARKLHPTTCPAGHSQFVKRRDGRVCIECGRARAKAYYRSRRPDVVRRGRSWLTDAERAQIRELIAAGRPHSEIAPLFNVRIATISRVRNR